MILLYVVYYSDDIIIHKEGRVYNMINLLLAFIYLSFISLGLPDSLLGSAWPSMYGELGVPISYAGIISMIIASGTIFSSLQSDRLTRKLGTGKVTAISVAMTAISLLGFSFSNSFWMLCLWAIPYGLGAGSVDVSLNNYVALNYSSKHMSWLHCMWGVGASLGPYVMAYAMTGGAGWNAGFSYVAVVQIILSIILIFSLPLWKKTSGENSENNVSSKAMSLKEIVRTSGVKEVMITFFCYCALEQTTGLWASSYLTLNNGISPEKAASFASLFFVGITAGRAISGFITMKLKDSQMIRLGGGIAAVGILILMVTKGEYMSLIGLIMIGLGCAPIYPCIIHSTQEHFGAEKSQGIIGVETASAYIGTLAMPPLFGFIADNINISLYPIYLFIILIIMFIMHEALIRKRSKKIEE